MNSDPKLPGAHPFFLPVEPGFRFCLFHRPCADAPARGGLLYVHPFAEEMNKSRRMAVLQARKLAALGYAVLQIDLLGCGDSSGELGDVVLRNWEQDLDAAAQWMRAQGYGELRVWGLRFGGLLAAHWAGTTMLEIEGVVLWQPVHSGEIHLNQFLRIGVAADLLASGGAGGGLSALRSRLAAGETIEIAGYDVTPKLARDLDGLKLAGSLRPEQEVDWLEVDPQANAALSPASSRVVDAWRSAGRNVVSHVVMGDPFWATVELTDCPSLIECTSKIAVERWSRTATTSTR